MKQPIVLLKAAAGPLAVCGLIAGLIVWAAIGAAAFETPTQHTDPTAAEQGSAGPPAAKADLAAAPADGHEGDSAGEAAGEPAKKAPDNWSMLFVFVLATFIGIGVIRRVSRLLHTPLMSLTNAISAIAVVGSIMVAGNPGHPPVIRMLGVVALFASMTNIVSGFLITDRMLKMFKTPGAGGKR